MEKTAKPKCQYCDKETSNLRIAKLKVPDELCVGSWWLCEDCREDNETCKEENGNTTNVR